MNMNLRELKAEEIKAKACNVNKGGVRLLLWKSALADLTILDEALQPNNYQVVYPRDGVCRISIWDDEKAQWIAKEGIGEGISPKNLANDALNRAGTAWGIGRELFTEDEIFIFKDKLQAWKEEHGADGKTVCRCYDEFKVLDVQYLDHKISDLTIGIALNGKIHNTVEFHFKKSPITTASNPARSLPSKADTTPETKAEKVTVSQKDLLEPDEVILVGNCRGRKYKDIKDTKTFASFLRWAAKSSPSYDDPAVEAQFERLKKLAAAVA